MAKPGPGPGFRRRAHNADPNAIPNGTAPGPRDKTRAKSPWALRRHPAEGKAAAAGPIDPSRGGTASAQGAVTDKAWRSQAFEQSRTHACLGEHIYLCSRIVQRHQCCIPAVGPLVSSLVTYHQAQPQEQRPCSCRLCFHSGSRDAEIRQYQLQRCPTMLDARIRIVLQILAQHCGEGYG